MNFQRKKKQLSCRCTVYLYNILYIVKWDMVLYNHFTDYISVCRLLCTDEIDDIVIIIVVSAVRQCWSDLRRRDDPTSAMDRSTSRHCRPSKYMSSPRNPNSTRRWRFGDSWRRSIHLEFRGTVMHNSYELNALFIYNDVLFFDNIFKFVWAFSSEYSADDQSNDITTYSAEV